MVFPSIYHNTYCSKNKHLGNNCQGIAAISSVPVVQTVRRQTLDIKQMRGNGLKSLQDENISAVSKIGLLLSTKEFRRGEVIEKWSFIMSLYRFPSVSCRFSEACQEGCRGSQGDLGTQRIVLCHGVCSSFNFFNDSIELSVVRLAETGFVKYCIKSLTSSDVCFMFYDDFPDPP